MDAAIGGGELQARAAPAAADKPHFLAMDGLRGVAALAVVMLHCFPPDQNPLVNAQLAVDLFFLLSGFVIAYSYDGKLAAGMSAGDFMLRRLIRLYPMVFVGAALGLFVGLSHAVTHGARAADGYSVHNTLVSGGLSFLVLPYLGEGINREAFNFNAPLWSLSFELGANLVYALGARRLPNWAMVLLVLASVVAVALLGPLGGSGKLTFWGGVPRVLCGFFGGVLLFRFWKSHRIRGFKGEFLALSGLLAVLFLIPKEIGGWWFVPTYLVLAAIVLAAAGATSPRLQKLQRLLGAVSYPLYAIHWPVMSILIWIAIRISPATPPDGNAAVATVAFLVAPVLAYGLAVFYETPARRILTGLLLRKRALRSPHAASQPS